MMLNKQVSSPKSIERINMMRIDKNLVAKVDIKKVATADLTQTNEFWSNLAVISLVCS